VFTVTKRFRFEAAHRLPDYNGKCEKVHGHSYVAEVTVTRSTLEDAGMVLDFVLLSETVGKWIDDHWDHACLLTNSDIEELIKIGEIPGPIDTMFKLFNTGALKPNAENMARMLFMKAHELLVGAQVVTDGCDVTKVRIQETEDSWAEYHFVSNQGSERQDTDC